MRLIRRPVLCNYYLTYRCNASCSFCDIWEKPSPYVTPDDLEANLRDMRRMGVKVIDFTGGEPLLHRQLHTFLQRAKDYGFITTVTTNCLLYPKRAESLHGLVDMLHFSLDSPDPDEHNASRGVDCFNHFVQSIDIAKALGERPDIIFTVLPDNIDRIREVYETFCLPNKLMLILNPVFAYNDVGTELSREQLDVLRGWGRKKYVYINNAFLKLREDGGNHINSPVCKAASSTIVISPENKLVFPCYHLDEKQLPIDGRLREVYESPEAAQLIRREGRYEGCEGCTVNCYMQPSFAVELNKYWWAALPSTLKYAYEKGTWRQMLPAPFAGR